MQMQILPKGFTADKDAASKDLLYQVNQIFIYFFHFRPTLGLLSSQDLT